MFEQRFQDIVRAERMRRANTAGSAVSLPRLHRLLSFRRTSTPGLPQNPPVLRGDERLDVADASLFPRPGTSQAESAAAPAAGIDATVGAAAAPEPQPSPLHIAFVDTRRPNGAASTAAEHQPQETQPTRRHRTAKAAGFLGQEKHDFSMGQLLAQRPGGRNAQFHDLTSEERDRLGGCEYQALRVLSVIVPLYFVLWQLLGCLALGAWINNNQPETPLRNGINSWWLGIFNGVSAFNNSGMSLLDANMIPFQSSYFVVITMGLMILAGNTAYPIFLRLIIWSLLKILTVFTDHDDLSGLKDTFRFILQYPRRVYTNLFPARPTWWLVSMLVLLNSIDWVAFELLNLGNPALEGIPQGSRVLDGLFQALGEARLPFALPRPHANSVSSRPFRGILYCDHTVLVYWSASALRDHDVHLGIPRGHHHAALQHL